VTAELPTERAAPAGTAPPPGLDAPFERAIVRVLRVGILLAIGLIVLGFLLWTAGGLSGADLLHTTTAISVSTLGGTGALALFLGLIVIILTPVARVGLATALFARQGDRAFVWFTLFVLAVLLATVAAGVWK
jgi:uncharacterized membrane protein